MFVIGYDYLLEMFVKNLRGQRVRDYATLFDLTVYHNHICIFFLPNIFFPILVSPLTVFVFCFYRRSNDLATYVPVASNSESENICQVVVF